MTKRIVSLLFATAVFGTTQAQQEVSVDKYTGTASISIPLYTLRAPGIAIPITAVYSASGVRVADPGETMGCNWVLTGPAAITREVRGLPDDVAYDISTTRDKRYGWLAQPSQIAAKLLNVPNATATGTSCNSAETNAFNYVDQLQQSYQMYDSEPDIYSYSFPGHAGKFVFDLAGNARTIPYDPIKIQKTTASSGSARISKIEITTEDGNIYDFSINDQLKYYTPQNSKENPDFFSRNRYFYINEIEFTSAWNLRQIRTYDGETVTYRYVTSQNPDAGYSLLSNRFHMNSYASMRGVAEWSLRVTGYPYRHILTQIESSLELLKLERSEWDDAWGITGVEVLSKLAGNAVIKKYEFEYLYGGPAVFYSGRQWYNADGEIADDQSHVRGFLTKIKNVSTCETLPAYTFAYAGVDPKKVYQNLPPLTSAEQDYWGYFNGNQARTLIPNLYVYSQLNRATAGQLAVPNAPYRLYPLAGRTDNVVLTNRADQLPNGADRRPAGAASFVTTTLLGTLTEMKLPSGGLVQFAYEPHEFYDALAGTNLVAGGTRIKTITLRDNVSGVSQRREYQYGESATRSSGRLLHVPRFAFAVPTSATGSTAQFWNNATVRSPQDLAPDPFETRTVGYGQVTEFLASSSGTAATGKTVYTFQNPGDNDGTPPTGLADGFTWNRTTVGLVRKATNCNAPVEPVQALYCTYPFPPEGNTDFRYGLVSNIQVLNAAGQRVKEQTFTYKYFNLGGTAAAVTGVCYERLQGETLFGYGKYTLNTDYFYGLVEETEELVDQQTASRRISTATRYTYNNQGRRAAVLQQNSDGTLYRTRYKYLADYAGTTLASGLLDAMNTRLAGGVTGDVVETVSEAIGTTKKVIGASLNTFFITNPGGDPLRTAPYQTFAWRPSQAMPFDDYKTDTARIVTTIGVSTFNVGARFRQARPISTVLEVNRTTPISAATTAGRRVASQHLAYKGSLPVVSIANALASEVMFADFEAPADKYNDFQYSVAPDHLTAVAKRSGKRGYHLAAGPSATLSTLLPTSSAPRYKLVFWAKLATAAPALTAEITGPGNYLRSFPAPALSGSGWQRVEVDLELNALPPPRTNYTLALKSTGGVYIDDVALLPTDAAVSSATYDLVCGKTSETAPDGKTTYYEYDQTNQLAFVRDHNGHIIRAVARRYPVATGEPTVDFTTSGRLMDRNAVQFTASYCGTGAQFNWSFGDPATSDNPSSTNNAATGASVAHTFDTNDLDKVYRVTLTVTDVSGQVYTRTKDIRITKDRLEIEICTNGISAVEACSAAPPQVQTCNGNTPLPSTTTYTEFVASVLGSTCGFTYQWQEKTTDFSSPDWTDMTSGTSGTVTYTGATTPTLHFNAPPKSYQRYRCVVQSTACRRSGESLPVQVEYQTSPVGTTPCSVSN